MEAVGVSYGPYPSVLSVIEPYPSVIGLIHRLSILIRRLLALSAGVHGEADGEGGAAQPPPQPCAPGPRPRRRPPGLVRMTYMLALIRPIWYLLGIYRSLLTPRSAAPFPLVLLCTMLLTTSATSCARPAPATSASRSPSSLLSLQVLEGP